MSRRPLHPAIRIDHTFAHTIATCLGAIFLGLGLIGFVEPGLLGTHLSTTHNLIHLVSGAAALYFGMFGSASGASLFCITFGLIYGALGVAGVLFGAPGESMAAGVPSMLEPRLLRVIPGKLELGTMDHVIHCTLGALFLVAGLSSHSQVMLATPRDRSKEIPPV
jgi:hypothetical protein